MLRHLSNLLVLCLLLAVTQQCGDLCSYCYYDSYDTVCYTCVDHAQYWSRSTCICSDGYYQSGQNCYPYDTGLPTWGYIFISFGVFVFVCLIVMCCRKARQNSVNARYNRLVEPVAYIAPVTAVAGAAAINTDARIRVSPNRNPTIPVGNPTNPTNPIGNPYGASPYSPYSPQYNQYAPPPTNPVAYPNEQICGACMRGGCDCKTSCGHASHKACLDQWKLPTCPTCRRHIPELNRS